MSEPVTAVPLPKPPTIDLKVVKAFLRLAGGYWTGATRLQAIALTLGLAACLILSVGITVALNHWNRWFFDALEKKDVTAMPSAILAFIGIIAVMATIGVGIVLTRETLQVRWRAWLIERLVGRWLDDRRFYHLNATRTEPANPEYRIADDTRWATEPLVDLGIGLVSAFFGAAAFISILWSVGGSYTTTIGASTITIPAYMVLVALVYGVIASLLMLWVGRPLAAHFYAKNEAEGDFRFALMRLRENAESVALMSGHKCEQRILGGIYQRVITQWMSIVHRHGVLTWITNSSGPMKPVIPLLFAAPKYFSGELTLGQVTQLAAAFLEVQIAISWVVDNFNRIAEWYASARRVMDMTDACDAAERQQAGQIDAITYDHHASNGLDFRSLTVTDPFGVHLLKNVHLTAKPGSSTYIEGDTSVGKTTLVRALAKLWTQGDGSITLPADNKIAIVPQKPYMPLGTLREVLAYPAIGHSLELNDAVASAALKKVGLPQLIPQLDDYARWDQRLSAGERQRLAIARLLVDAPGVIVLDDALSALDDASQTALVRTLRAERPHATIFILGQAEPPSGLHDHVVVLERQGAVATIRQTSPEKV